MHCSVGGARATGIHYCWCGDVLVSRSLAEMEWACSTTNRGGCSAQVKYEVDLRVVVLCWQWSVAQHGPLHVCQQSDNNSAMMSVWVRSSLGLLVFYCHCCLTEFVKRLVLVTS